MKKQILSFSIIIMILTSLAGCSQQNAEEKQAPAETAEITDTTEAADEMPEDETLGHDSDTIMFTDSTGRVIELPENIERIAPSGPLAQIVLYTLCPDKLVGFASDLSEIQFEYIDEKYINLPVFGNFYAETLNLETVMAADPQVIIDIGEAKPTVQEDMEGIQDKTGIPSVFVEMELDSMVSAYETLGELLGEEEQANNLAGYIGNTLKETKEKSAGIAENDKVTVYYGQDDGLTAVIKGTVHADVIDIIGADNVADVEETVRGGASEISMEQLMLWDPDVILFAPLSIYETVSSKPEWQELRAVTEGRYYEVPEGPYNWMGRPPSVNRILGVKWLSDLLYPEVFQYDMVKETQDFYELFYHCEISAEKAEELLSRSTIKQ